MAIFLKVVSGPDAGKTIEMQEGVTIGRSPNANFTFADPKMSGRHVQVVRDSEGLVLVDMGSKNGFRANGVKVAKTALVSGSSVRIGTTDFEVTTEEEKPLELVDAPPAPPVKTPQMTRVTQLKTKVIDAKTKVVVPELADLATATKIPVEPPPPPPKWYEYFVQFVQNSVKKVKSKPRELRPFRQLVKLSILTGIQTETAWMLGYGPRQIGPESCDLVIEDPAAPPICFTIEPNSDSAVFSTDHPDQVKVNGRAVRSDTLKPGDVISFASTSIRFGFELE